MKLGVLCSGGKDSLYACYRALQKEEVACLITVLSENPESYMFHTPNIHLTHLQAAAAGIPLVQRSTEGREEAELADLREAIRDAVREFGIEGVVSGAILSVYQATRVQRICSDLGLWCFNPLWYTGQDSYMRQLLASGFQVLISGVFSTPFDASWLGRTMDTAMLEELIAIARKHHITLTGEGGEYETFVLDAPFFHKRIEVLSAEKDFARDHGVYRIRGARLVPR
jgi:ABC transporter with metal-binding/Fe-S-binding domain ATP-binding protein